MLYLSILLLLFMLSCLYDYCGIKKGRTAWYVVILIIFICIAGLRYRLGVDSIRYENTYNSLPTIAELATYDFSESRFGVGYIVFNSIARSISDEFVCMQFLQAIYVNGVVFWFFYRYSHKIFFCVILYAVGLYFNFMCEVMREACAVATLLLAWPHFISREWLKYYLLATLCVFFHVSGFIALLLPVLYLPKIRNFFMIGRYTILVLLALFVVASSIGFAFIDYFNVFYFFSGFEENVNNYANNELSGQVLNIGGVISTFAKWCLFPYLAVLYFKKNNKDEKHNNHYSALNFMVGLCMIMAVLSVPIAIFYRYNNYFFPFAIAAIGNWVYVRRPFSNLRVRFGFIAWQLLFIPYFFLCLYGYFIIKNNNEIYELARYYPYSSIIEKSTDPIRSKVQRYHHAY